MMPTRYAPLYGNGPAGCHCTGNECAGEMKHKYGLWCKIKYTFVKSYIGTCTQHGHTTKGNIAPQQLHKTVLRSDQKGMIKTVRSSKSTLV